MVIAIYLKIRFSQIMRFSQQIGLFRLLFILCCIFFIYNIIYQYSDYYQLPILFFIIIYRYQSFRRDRTFIKQSIKYNYWIYWIDYTIFATLIIPLSIIKGYYLDLVLYSIIIFVTPFLSNIKIRTKNLSIPFFRKGSYEYKSMLRRFYLIIILIYIFSFIGLYNDNERIFYFCIFISSLVWLSSLIKTETPLYILTYNNSRNLIQEKILNNLLNTSVLYIPFLLISILGGWKTIGFTLQLLIVTQLMITGSNIIKYWFNNNEFITSLLVVLILIPLFILAMIYPLFIFLYLGLDIVIIFKAIDKLDFFFKHDNNPKLK